MKSTKTYEAPKLLKHGALEKLTQGNTDGSQLDATFPRGTPDEELTFS